MEVKKGLVFAKRTSHSRFEVLWVNENSNIVGIEVTHVADIVNSTKIFKTENSTMGLEFLKENIKNRKFFKETFIGFPKTKAQEMDDFIHKTKKEIIDTKVAPWWKFW